MPELATENGGLYYQVLGAKNGRPAEWITLLHNFMSTGQAAWGMIAERLAQRCRVLLPDLPGHGRSLGQPAMFDHLEMARQIAELMRHAGAERGHLAGCSSGGMIAQLMVQHGLANPATLTLVSSTHSVNPAVTGEQARLHPKDFRASEGWMEATARLHDPFRYEGYFEDVLLHRFRRLEPERVIDLPLDALREWTLPVCLIHGAEDEFFPVGIAERMADVLPDAELHIIPDQGHGLIFRRPGRVRAIMEDFLVRHPLPLSDLARQEEGAK